MDGTTGRNWGGARRGAGRPSGGTNKGGQKIQMTFKLSPQVADFLRRESQGKISQSKIIEQAIKGFYGARLKS
jgi:hypothetical protein